MKGANRRAAREFGVRRSVFGDCGSACGVARFGDELVHALQHFARGFVGEGHTQDVSGRDALPDHVGDAIGDDARLAGARAGEDQDRPVDRLYGPSLLRVQRIDIQHSPGV